MIILKGKSNQFNVTQTQPDVIRANQSILEYELVASLLLNPASRLKCTHDHMYQILAMATAAFPRRRFCIMRDLMPIDVMLSEAEIDLLSDSGAQPTILYARSIV
jgi:hypothetical protein